MTFSVRIDKIKDVPDIQKYDGVLGVTFDAEYIIRFKYPSVSRKSCAAIDAHDMIFFNDLCESLSVMRKAVLSSEEHSQFVLANSGPVSGKHYAYGVAVF